MGRNGLQRMDVDIGWAYRRKVRRLQLLFPEAWTTYWAAYLVLLGEAWGHATRRVTLEEAWCFALPCSPQDATAALVKVGILDKGGRIPAGSWADWFGPVENRLKQYSEMGVKSGVIRRQRTTLNVGSRQVQTHVQPNQPTNQPTPRGRARGEDGLKPLRDLLPPPPGYGETK